MGAAQTDKGAASGKWGLIAASILGATLVVASIWSLARALSNSSTCGSVIPTNEAAATDAALSHAEVEKRQHELAEQRPAPAVAPTSRNNEKVILQREKTKANQLIIKHLKQYVRDNPGRDNRDIEKQIKRRENQVAPIQ